jgi:hypothetical protein
VDTDVGFGGWGALTGDVFASDGFNPRLFVSRPYESTTNHYFLGLYNSEGFTNVSMSNVDELDHLQYGYSIAGVPEPSTYALMGLGLAVVACLARRR